MCAPETLKHVRDHAKADQEVTKMNTKILNSSPGEKRHDDLKKGVRYGTASLALLFVATTVTMPHLQSRRDALGCDSMCVGSMTSVRSMLTLAGATLVGKLSDSSRWQQVGGARRICLFLGVVASTVGLLMGYHATNIQLLWASIIPGSLLQQNADILKAMFSNYHDALPEQSSSTDRAASAGLLGMAVGLALMIGPFAGVSLFSTYQQATYFGVFCAACSMVLITIMPSPATNTQQLSRPSSGKKGFFASFDTPSARTPAALFLMASRVCMSMAFHIFQTIWTVSLRERFQFGPKDYGRFLSFIGLTYALSQGFFAKVLLKFFGGHTAQGRVRLLMSCCLCLGCGRYFAFQTNSLPVVYGLFAGIVTALGLVNTMFSADTSQIALPNEIGSLFGVLAAVESAAGMAGPIAGGALSYIHPVRAPLFAVLFLYACVFLMVSFGYESLVLKNGQEFKNKERKDQEALLKRQN